MHSTIQILRVMEESYTCEEGGVHLRISFELEKQIIIKKTVEVGQ